MAGTLLIDMTGQDHYFIGPEGGWGRPLSLPKGTDPVTHFEMAFVEFGKMHERCLARGARGELTVLESIRGMWIMTSKALTEANGEIRTLRAASAALRSDLTETRGEVASLRSSNAALRDELAAMRDAIAELRGRVP